jgi:hypothetical protein
MTNSNDAREVLASILQPGTKAHREVSDLEYRSVECLSGFHVRADQAIRAMLEFAEQQRAEARRAALDEAEQVARSHPPVEQGATQRELIANAIAALKAKPLPAPPSAEANP